MTLEEIFATRNIRIRNTNGTPRTFMEIFEDIYIKLDLIELQTILTLILREENKGNRVFDDEQ